MVPDYFSISEKALSVSFGNRLSVEVNELVLELAETINAQAFDGFAEVLPAYSSLTVFYDALTVRKTFPQFETTASAVKNFIENCLDKVKVKKKRKSKVIEVPVSFAAKDAPDLNFISDFKEISPPEIIEIFTKQTYRVFMLGFLPAFAYMGIVDERISVPRRNSPRLQVAQGSVGIAGNQTGIYPLNSPGGWQIIGKTELKIFTPKSSQPSLLKAGDLVKFYQI